MLASACFHLVSTLFPYFCSSDQSLLSFLNSYFLNYSCMFTFYGLAIQGLKRGLVVSKRLIEVYIWLVVKCVNMIRAIVK